MIYIYEVTDGKKNFNMTSLRPCEAGNIVYNGEGDIIQIVKEAKRLITNKQEYKMKGASND